MKKRLIRTFVFLLILAGYSIIRPAARGGALDLDPETFRKPPFENQGADWADSLMLEMSLEERIAQMVMIYGYSNMGVEHEKVVLKQLRKQKVGGILWFQGSPGEQIRLINLYQEASEIPLLMSIDGENGAGMRLDDCISYPRAMILGSISDNSLIYELGRDMAGQFKRLGIQMNLAPVADINNNIRNPVIGTRSFGEDRVNVADKVVAMVAGMQDEGLLVAAKHFPGHGDTDMDSHKALPIIEHSRSRLDSVELYPFRSAIDHGLSGIMVAHLEVPALDDRTNRATTLSKPAITGVLKEEMGFRGLIITDALNMKGLSNYFKPGLREVEAVKAGNDILLMPADVSKAISAVKKAVRQGELTEDRINESCRKILLAKYWTGLHHFEAIDTTGLLADLQEADYHRLYRELVEHSLVLRKNKNDLLPLGGLDSLRFASLSIGLESGEEPMTLSDRYLEGDHFSMSKTPARDEQEKILAKVTAYDVLLVNVLGTSRRSSRGYGISEESMAFLDLLAERITQESVSPNEKQRSATRLLLNVAGIPYALGRFKDLEDYDAVIVSHSDDSLYQSLVQQSLFGGEAFSGKMPVSAGIHSKPGDGVIVKPANRLAYAAPGDVGLNADTLALIDDIVREALDAKAIPGCQVLVARNSKVVLHKCYGYHTYMGKSPTEPDDIYDLASITKMIATTAMLMRMKDQGQFSEKASLGDYPPVPAGSNKADLLNADILAHQAGLRAWIPFYYETLEPLDRDQELVSVNRSRTNPLKIGDAAFFNRHVKWVDSLYSKQLEPGYPHEVADDMYLRADWRDTILSRIYQSELPGEEARYSGLGFYIYPEILEQATDTSLYPYVWHHFYAPMGAHSLGYKPLSRFPKDRIVPTENDILFRKQLLQGHVHDMGAAMMGGISGNAGLFGSANDLAKMMQMFLNGGSYGADRYISDSTLHIFTTRYNPEGEVNHRGLGFNKPVYWEDDAGPACDSASPASFGHSGFTGTLAWADPENGLVYIFLSNRVHPDMGNSKLIDMDIRTRIQQVVYDALEE